MPSRKFVRLTESGAGALRGSGGAEQKCGYRALAQTVIGRVIEVREPGGSLFLDGGRGYYIGPSRP